MGNRIGTSCVAFNLVQTKHLPGPADLVQGMLNFPAVVDMDIGDVQLWPGGRLGGDPLFRILNRQTVPGNQPGYLLVGPASHQPDTVAILLHAAFNKFDGVDRHHAGPVPAHEPPELSADSWVRQSLQFGKFATITKHDSSQRSAVDLAIVVDNRLSEVVDERFPEYGFWFDKLVVDPIRID